MRVAMLCLAMLAIVSGFRAPSATQRTQNVPSSSPVPLGRRAVVSGIGLAALLAGPLSARANTQPMLDKPMEKFESDEDKRQAFQKKQKTFKKAWRKELSALEFASNDAEAEEAIRNLIKLIRVNGNEIPEGVRKMDLDQVYRIVKPKLSKEARMEYAQLETIVRQIVTVKSMSDERDLLGY